MPTYQYACTECGKSLEAVQSFSDPALTECPACQGKLRKMFNSVGIVFKGSGFYRTDSRSGGVGTETAKADGKADAKSESTSTSTGSSDSGKSGADKGSSSSNGSAGSANGSSGSSSSSSSSGSSGGAKSGAGASKP